jgi:DNA-binding XRE family transcriptional regulator
MDNILTRYKAQNIMSTIFHLTIRKLSIDTQLLFGFIQMNYYGPKELPLPETPKAQDFGRRIREARHERGLTVSGLAEMVGYTRAHISGVERGRSGVSLDFITKCDQALDLNGSLSEFVYPTKSNVAPNINQGSSAPVKYSKPRNIH